MLRILNIKNIAVIESAEIEFAKGFNVLTGETGAGKSIIIDSINALLGERVSREIIRSGSSNGVVSGYFCDISDEVLHMLDEYGISPEDDGSLLISREIKSDGKNICRINGVPSTLSVLRAVGQNLVAIHGQNDTQNLYSEDKHLGMLDEFANLSSLVAQYRNQYAMLNKIKEQQQSLKTDESEKLRRIEMLTYQRDEIESANLKNGEEETLTEKRNILLGKEKIVSALNSIYIDIYGDDESVGVCDKISSSYREMSTIESIDERFANLYSKIGEIKYAVDDVVFEVKDILESLELDSESLDFIENRLDLIYKLKRKYGTDIKEILAYLDQISKEISNVENSDERAKELEIEYKKQYKIVSELAMQLSQARNIAASSLSAQVTNELHGLCMNSAEFIVSIQKNQNDDKIVLDRNGCDTVVFMASTNQGEPAKSISKAASGGELSRMMLALKNVMSKGDDVQTMIFDEIDTGVSGRAAGSIGEKLYSVACEKQVLCVTHLAQISAFADNHLLIEKGEKDGKTFTEIFKLADKRRILELSRIISGKDITESTLKTAEEMLSNCEQNKKSINMQKGI